MLQMSKGPQTIGTPYNGDMMALGNGGPLGQPTADPTRAAPGGQQPAQTTGGNLFQMAGQPGTASDAPTTGAMAYDTGAAAGPMKDAGQVTVSDNSLVSKQLGSLLSSDSPYMQLAKTRALQESNARGLANSSMAIGAGQAAAIDRALPIAQQDAQTYGTTDRFNVEQGNLFARDGNNFGRESALRKLGIFADMETQGRDQTFRRDERMGSQEFQSGENRADRDWRTGERIGGQEFTAGQAGLDRDWRTGERIGGQEFQSGENAADRTFRRDERVDGQQFQAGENALQRAFQTGERVSEQDFRGAQAVLDREQQTRIQQLQDTGMDRRQAEQIAAQERSQRADQVFSSEQRAMDRDFTAGQSALDRTFTSERDTVNFSRELERMGFASKLEQSRLAPQFTLAIAERTQAGVQAIMADPNIDPEAKRAAIQNLVDYQNNTLQWAETFFGVSINKMQGGTQAAPGAAAPPIFNVPGAPAPMPQAPGPASPTTFPAGFAPAGGMSMGNRWNEDIFGAAHPQ